MTGLLLKGFWNGTELEERGDEQITFFSFG